MGHICKDMLIAKNETENFRSFRFSFPVISGSYYYEVFPLTNEWMRFGWATREAGLSSRTISWQSKNIQIGDDEHSIGLEFGKACRIYHNGIYSIKKLPHKSKDVIGCLIDVNKQQFKFYINGKQVKSPDNVNFSTWPYYATVSLGEEQKCLLNFGQMPFKFSPKNIQFSDFNEASGNIQKFQLTKTFEYRGYFWYRHPAIDNRIDLFYCDPTQDECDNLVRQLQLMVHNQTTHLDASAECGRFVQSVIEVVNRRLTCDHSDLLTRLVRQKFCEIKYQNFETAKLLELLYPYHQLSVTPANSTKCHNITLIMIMLYFTDSFFVSDLIANFDFLFSKTLKAFIKPITFLTDPWSMIYAFICLEHPLPQTTKILLNDPSTVSTLWWYSEIFGHVSSVSRLYEPSCDLMRLQVGMCASWFLNQTMGAGKQHFPSHSTLDSNDQTEHLKLSNDCLSVRNDYRSWKSVLSLNSVSSDIFYYEAVLLTDGNMKIGWATKQTYLKEFGIGCDEYSIGFEGSDGHKIQNQFKNFCDNSLISTFTSKSQWASGDIVGCLIDCNTKIFQFYLNGKLVKCKEKCKDPKEKEIFVHFSDEPYHAAVSLDSHQQCYLNLGQCPFRHPPAASFRTFHSVTLNEHTIPLYLPRLSECYSRALVLEKDLVELVFEDYKQKKIDVKAKKIDQNILNSKNFPINLTKVDRLRLIQSLIEVSGTRLLDSSLDVYANWIADLIQQSTSDNFFIPDLVSQLLYPYLTLCLDNDNVTRHRNVCIVFSSLILVMEDFPLRVNLFRQLLTYFTQIVINSNQVKDEQLIIFALISLENMNLTEGDKETIKANPKFCKILEAQSYYSTYHSQNDQSNSLKLAFHQFEFCSRWFLDNVLNSTLVQQTDDTNSQATLNPLDRSLHLKLSPDLLTARSDRHWQSVRSICTANKVVYYEVTLHTSGTMRIGWANKRYNLSQDPIGTDDTSIAFDGYNKCVWHENKRIKLKAKDSMPRWKSGDIVGCLIDVDANSFSFYINHQLIYTQSLSYFARFHHYFAAVSLHTFQQCRFNFGPTELPPPRIDFHTFNSIFDIRGSVTNLARSFGSSINNSIILVKSSFKANNVNVQQNYEDKKPEK